MERLKGAKKDLGKHKYENEEKLAQDNKKWKGKNKKRRSEENSEDRVESKFNDESLLLDKKYKFGTVFQAKYKEGLDFPKFDDDEKMCFRIIGRGWCKAKGCWQSGCHERSTMTPGEKSRWIEFRDNVLKNYKKENP